MTDNLPEGYKAKNSKSYIFAVDSGTLSNTEEVHGTYQQYSWDEKLGVPNWINEGPDVNELGDPNLPLDAFAELNLKGDSRLTKLKQLAQGYGERYADPSSLEYIANVLEREKKITSLILEDMKQEFGSVNLAPGTNAAENHAKNGATTYSIDTGIAGKHSVEVGHGITGTVQVELQHMEKDSLAPRHIAPLLSILLHEAKVSNHMLSTMVGNVDNDENILFLDSKKGTKLHQYLVTDLGHAVIDPIHLGAKDAVEKAYQPIINKSTVDNVVHHGHALITSETIKGNGGTIFGGHNGNGDWRTAEAGMNISLERHNDAEREKQTKLMFIGGNTFDLNAADTNKDKKLTNAEIMAAIGGNKQAAEKVSKYLAHFQGVAPDQKGGVDFNALEGSGVINLPKRVFDKTPSAHTK